MGADEGTEGNGEDEDEQYGGEGSVWDGPAEGHPSEDHGRGERGAGVIGGRGFNHIESYSIVAVVTM